MSVTDYAQKLRATLPAVGAASRWPADEGQDVHPVLRRGEQTLEPFADVARLADGQMQAEVWRQRCRDLGIGQLTLAGEDMGYRSEFTRSQRRRG